MGDFSENFYKAHENALELDEFSASVGGLPMELERGVTFALEFEFVLQDGAVCIENTFVLRGNSVEKLMIFEDSIIKI